MIAFQSPPDSLDPFRARTARAASLFEHTLGMALLVIDPATGSAMPWLAEALPTVSEQTVRWTIRKGARWDDGRPVRSDDFLWTFAACERLAGELGRAASAVAGTVSLEVVDEGTFLQHVESRHARERFGRGFVVLPEGTDTGPRGFEPPSACGPYRLSERDSGRLVLERKRDWWGDEDARFSGAYGFDRLVQRYVADESTSLRMMAAGDVDLLGLSARASTPAGMKTRTYHLPGFSFVGWNNEDPLLEDAGVRRALSLTVPKERINATAFDGMARVIDEPFDVFEEEDAVTRFDPIEAARILDSLGIKDEDGDGLRDHDEEPMSLHLLAPAGELPWVDAILPVWTEVLAQVGVELRTERLATPALVSALRDGAFDAFLVVWTVHDTETSFRSLFHSQEVGGRNFQRTSDAGLDAAIEALENGVDGARDRLESMLLESRPITTLFQHPSRLCWNPRRLKPTVGRRGLFLPTCAPR